MRFVVLVLVAVALAGLASLVSMTASGAEPRWRWGYVAAVMSFVLSAGQMGPVLSMASRVGRGYWGAGLRRAADVLALSGLLTAPLVILLVAQLPEERGRASIWFDWPGAPRVWDSIAAIGLAIAGVALVWVVTWPERGGLGWAGTPLQWRVLTRGTIALGSMYSMLVVFVHLLVVSDLAMSLVPGWDSAVIPPYHAVSGFEASIALVVVLLAATRQLDPRLSRSCSKLLLSLALMWFYFVWCELLTYWYGRTPDEQSLLALFMLGPSGTLFGISAVCEFVVPLVVLVWNASRSNPITLSAVAAIVVIGNLIDRVRLYVPAWTVVTPTPTDHLPDVLPPLPLPGLSELIACVGVLAAVALVLVVAIRSFSAVSQWEVKAIDRLTPERPVLRTRTIVIARPS